MASFYRTMDKLSAVAYRGLTLGISMLPLLFFVPVNDFNQITSIFPILIFASLSAAFANFAGTYSYSYLPVSVASALMTSSAIFCNILIGKVFLDEALTVKQLILVCILTILIVFLCFFKSPIHKTININIQKGLSSSLLFGLFIGIGFSLVGYLSKSTHPFLIAYLWELLIGIILLFFIFLRKYLLKRKFVERLSWKKFATLGVYASPTVIGTASLLYACTLGPTSIAYAINATMIVFNCFFGYLFYKEKITLKQFIIITVTCINVILLKIL